MSQHELLRAFQYDADTGHLYWKTRPADDFSSPKEHKKFLSIRAGEKAGSELLTNRRTPSKIQLYYAGKVRAAHRIIWIMVHGVLSQESFVDHINGNPFDNRLCNLRLSDDKANQSNRSIPINNTSGFKGVTWSRPLGKWKSTIRANGEGYHLGYHDTKGMAALAYAKASIQHFGMHSVFCRSIAQVPAHG